MRCAFGFRDEWSERAGDVRAKAGAKKFIGSAQQQRGPSGFSLGERVECMTQQEWVLIRDDLSTSAL